MLPTGLRWRLAAWVAAVVVICTAVSFTAVYRGTGTQLRRQIDSEIAGDLANLKHAVASVGGHGPAVGEQGSTTAGEHGPSSGEHDSAPATSAAAIAAAARTYVSGQPFSASSTLQFAIVTAPHAQPITVANRPELLGAPKPDHGESVAEQSQENRLAHQIVTVRDGYSTLSLPDVGDLRLLKHRLTVGATSVIVGVGEPLASVAHAQQGVARAFILAGILALLAALGASYLIGTRFSRPLRQMAAVATRVDAGDLHPRIHDVGKRGDEVQVLAESFNHMLDRLTDAFAGQRAFVADASHELRTPLTVIRGQLEVLAAQERPSAEEVRRVEHLVAAEIARITRLVDDLLLLAKAEQTEFLRMEEISLQAFVHELWEGVQPLAERRFELGRIPAGRLRADPDRLAQALRNLIANAIAHTRPEQGLVRLEVQTLDRGRIRFVVSDDGPGIPHDQLERVFDRFHRTDAARDRASGGTGLGLAIVRAIAEAHGGAARALPASPGAARALPASPGALPTTPGGTREPPTTPGGTREPPAGSGGTRMEIELPGFRAGVVSAERELSYAASE